MTVRVNVETGLVELQWKGPTGAVPAALLLMGLEIAKLRLLDVTVPSDAA